MPNVKSAVRRVKKSRSERDRNRRDRSRLRTAVKRAREAAGAQGGSESVREAISLIDRSARKGLIHKNKAARDKSRLARRAQLGGQADT